MIKPQLDTKRHKFYHEHNSEHHKSKIRALHPLIIGKIKA